MLHCTSLVVLTLNCPGTFSSLAHFKTDFRYVALVKIDFSWFGYFIQNSALNEMNIFVVSMQSDNSLIFWLTHATPVMRSKSYSNFVQVEDASEMKFISLKSFSEE